MWMGGSAAGNVVRVRVDVSDEVANEIESLAAGEPPLATRDSVPVHKDDYTRLLGGHAPVTATSSVTYLLPSGLAYGHDVAVVSSGTDEARELLARLEAEGMPATMVELGFLDPSHLWPPWCAALDNGAVVSVAFTARLSSDGAEVGVATATRYRGRGLATATTAAWTALPALAGRIRFYSTEVGNAPSRRVAERLQLPLLGAEFAIT